MRREISHIISTEFPRLAVNFIASPKIHSVIDSQEPRKAGLGKRTIILSYERYFDDDWIAAAATELADPKISDALDAAEIAALARAAGHRIDSPIAGIEDLVGGLRRLVAARWDELAVPLARALLANASHGREIGTCLPDLVNSPALIEGMIDLLEDKETLHLSLVLDRDALRIASLDQARRLFPLTPGQYDKDLRLTFLGAMARALGWTPWIKLQTIFLELPGLAGDDCSEEPNDPNAPQGDFALTLRKEAWTHIVNDEPVRAIAQLVRDLDGALAYASPGVRGVYVDRLRVALGGDTALRHAAIEALLDRPRQRQEDLGLFAATALTEADDESFVADLTRHPQRELGYRAAMVQTAVFGGDEAGSLWPRPTITGIAEGLFQLRLAASSQEPARTWLGDRLLEQMIEHTSASEEEKFARDYPDFSEADEEEGLLRIFFAHLAHQYSQLDKALLATARAIRSAHRTRVSLVYRSISKSEEGNPGISRTGDEADAAERFSADLCLIVDPYLDGRALGKRATLIQAKRLYRRDASAPEKGFAASYRLKPNQIRDLLAQTASSFFLFQGPGSAGRAIPILPTQLVSDLAYHQAATAGQIDHAMVGRASQPFSQWLTYDVLALRTGDPLEQLVAKAEGAPGRRPRPLARFGTVEIEVRVGDPLKETE
jgi:hypothetical protein